MLNTSIAVISIFLLVPALIAFLAVRGYKNIVRREQAEAEAAEAEAKNTALREAKEAQIQSGEAEE